MSLVSTRPAEIGGAVAAAVAALVVYFAGLDPAIAAPLALVVGFVPAAITWLVTTIRGGEARPPSQAG